MLLLVISSHSRLISKLDQDLKWHGQFLFSASRTRLWLAQFFYSLLHVTQVHLLGTIDKFLVSTCQMFIYWIIASLLLLLNNDLILLMAFNLTDHVPQIIMQVINCVCLIFGQGQKYSICKESFKQSGNFLSWYNRCVLNKQCETKALNFFGDLRYQFNRDASIICETLRESCIIYIISILHIYINSLHYRRLLGSFWKCEYNDTAHFFFERRT